ncbi:MAG: hypothetical protein JAY74_25390 [Candidatus Thiodiazotropha taylori]|nr:hypothetical protein [Candidatus Thiodiazotropha taylori]
MAGYNSDSGISTTITPTNGRWRMPVKFYHIALEDGKIEVIIDFEGDERRFRMEDGETVHIQDWYHYPPNSTNLVRGTLDIDVDRRVIIFNGEITAGNVASSLLNDAVVVCF